MFLVSSRPVDVRLPHPPVTAGREQRLDLVEQRQPFLVGKVGDPAHRREERQHSVLVEGLGIRQPPLVQLLERRLRQGAAPLARRVARRVEVERVDSAVVPVWATLAQEPLHCGNRGLRRPSWEVPHHDERALRTQHAGDLGEPRAGVEPMEGLGGEHGIDRGVGERDLLSARGKHLGFGAQLHEQAAHSGSGLHSDHTVERGYEQTGELARARAELEHCRRRWQARNVEDSRRPARPALLVVLGPAVQAAGGKRPADRGLVARQRPKPMRQNARGR